MVQYTNLPTAKEEESYAKAVHGEIKTGRQTSYIKRQADMHQNHMSLE